MRIPDQLTQVRRMLDCRLKKLGLSSPVLAASLHTYANRCGRPTCRCHRGGPLHHGQHVTCKGQGNKTRTVYVPQGTAR